MPTSGSPLIEVEGLWVSFRIRGGTVSAVRDLSVAIAPGDSFGIVGESGSGKSTVLRAIAGLVAPARGTIRIDGQGLGPRRTRAQRRMLQMVFQDPLSSLHPGQTVDRTLREPIEIHGLGEPDRRIVEAMETVDLGTRLRFRYPHQLSGGQRQRVAIARALILDPRILLLDEPTSALDVSVQAEVLNLLKRLGAERRLTSLLVSHDLAVVAHLCSRIAVMSEGRLIEVLEVEDLRRGTAGHAYTRALIASSRGYVRRSGPNGPALAS